MLSMTNRVVSLGRSKLVAIVTDLLSREMTLPVTVWSVDGKEDGYGVLIGNGFVGLNGCLDDILDLETLADLSQLWAKRLPFRSESVASDAFGGGVHLPAVLKIPIAQR